MSGFRVSGFRVPSLWFRDIGDNGKENGNCYIVYWGYIRDNGEDNGNYYLVFQVQGLGSGVRSVFTSPPQVIQNPPRIPNWNLPRI